jgi:hypothetical protein
MQTNRSNVGSLIGGAVLIAFGLLSLAGQIFRNVNWGQLWPFLIIGIGGLFFVAMLAGGKQAAGFAIPGSIIGGIGLALLIQSITRHWEPMPYFWTLIILFVGTGIYIMGSYGGDESQKQSGIRVMKVGFILFLLFGAFFEMLFSSYNGLIFPILLILLGVYMMVARSGILGGKKNNSTDSLPPVH